MKVCKFGGTSLADARQIVKVQCIVFLDSSRRYIVVSAPGKRSPFDVKVTDLLKEWYRLNSLGQSSEEIKNLVIDRFVEIANGFSLKINMNSEFDEISNNMRLGASEDYLVSRGEYLMAKIVAGALGCEFLDAADCIRFDKNGRHIKDDQHIRDALESLKGRRVVIPGFYGSKPDGTIKTFSRGGSDVTGAIIARATKADLYENWTDVSGILMADPRVVKDPQRIEVVTYQELRELTYMGANVFHEEAMFPVWEAKINTVIKNTNKPNDPGTLIVSESPKGKNPNIIVGVAGRKDFSVIKVEKMLMNLQVGFVRQICTILERKRISFEHTPSGIDTWSVIIDDRQLRGQLEVVASIIRNTMSPDLVVTIPNMALIAVVGKEMVHTPGVAAKVFLALAKKGINIRMISQGSSEISIIIGVENNDYENAIRAIYGAFVVTSVFNPFAKGFLRKFLFKCSRLLGRLRRSK